MNLFDKLLVVFGYLITLAVVGLLIGYVIAFVIAMFAGPDKCPKCGKPSCHRVKKVRVHRPYDNQNEYYNVYWECKSCGYTWIKTIIEK